MATNQTPNTISDPQTQAVSNQSLADNGLTKISFKQYLLTSILTLSCFYLIQFATLEFGTLRAIGSVALSPLGLFFGLITIVNLFHKAILVFILFLIINGIIAFKLEKLRVFHIVIWFTVSSWVYLISYLIITDLCDCGSHTLWANGLIIAYWSATSGLAKVFLAQSRFFNGKWGITLPIASIVIGGISLLILSSFDVNTSSAIEKRYKEARIKQNKPYVENIIKNMGGYFFPNYIPDWVKPDYEINCDGRVCGALDTPEGEGIMITFKCKEKTFYDELIITEFSNKTVDNYNSFASLSDFRDYHKRISYSPMQIFTPLQDIEVNNNPGHYYSSQPPTKKHHLFYILDAGNSNENKYSIQLQADESCYSGDMKQELIKIAESMQKQEN